MIFLFFPLLAHALTFEVIGACSATPAFQGSLPSAPSNVGKASVEFFDREKIPYIGSELGFNSILNTPTDRDSIEIPAPGEIRAYGWCYEVDGKQPDQMPNLVVLNGAEHIRWFYAYSLQRKNEWVDYCTPAYTVKPAKICK